MRKGQCDGPHFIEVSLRLVAGAWSESVQRGSLSEVSHFVAPEFAKCLEDGKERQEEILGIRRCVGRAFAGMPKQYKKLTSTTRKGGKWSHTSLGLWSYQEE